MGTDHAFGFHFKVPPFWNAWFVRYWLASSVVWITVAFAFDLTWEWFVGWCEVFIVLFLIPELISIRWRDDRLPPLTHTIRYFLPNDFSFPLLWFLPGAAGARWLGMTPWWRYVSVGVVAAVLGWFTTHFTVTYSRPVPHPHRSSRGETALDTTESWSPTPIIPDPNPW